MAVRRRALSLLAAMAEQLNPVTSGPAAPLASDAALESFGPSLMPRTSFHQGVAAGLAVLVARIAGIAVDAIGRRLAPPTSPLPWRIAVRALIMAGGSALGRIPERDDEPTSRAAVRSAGQVVGVAALGGIFHQLGKGVERRISTPWLSIVTGFGGFGFAARRLARNLRLRNGVIDRWTEGDPAASLIPSVAIGAVIATSGRLVGRAFLASRSRLADYMGERPFPRLVGRGINAALWGAGLVSAYGVLAWRMSRQNDQFEPGFATSSAGDHVSGGRRSISPFAELGRQGRRYVAEVVTPEVIEQTLGEPAANHPVRVYVGFDSEPLYPTGRSEMALDEMERLGAFDRKYLLLMSPTGTGWVDHTLIESAEILSRGDIATACIQYGKAPSFLELRGVSLGREQFRQLLWGVRQRFMGVPDEDRPVVLVFGESLGAWSSTDVLMHHGVAGFDHYGIHRALWFGLPGIARWSRTGMREGRDPLTPEGTVHAFDNFDQYRALPEDQKDGLRAIVVDHDNDPIAQLSLRLAVKRPLWLDGQHRRGVPESMSWSPFITFLQVLVDAMNATVIVPGEFKSFGHDYRADTPDFALHAFGFPPVTEEQMSALHRTLVERELDRGRRIREGPTPIRSTIQ